jgi:hypothetical protein
MIDVEMAKIDVGVMLPEGNVSQIHEGIILLTRPKEVHGFGESNEDQQTGVVERKDTQGATSIKRLEEVRDIDRIDENAGDQKSGEGEEEIDSNEGRAANIREQVKETRAGVVIGPEKVVNEHQENGESANAIQCRNMGKPTRVFPIVVSG